MTERTTRQVIKGLSHYELNARKGNFKLVGGKWCVDYVEDLIWKIMDEFGYIVDDNRFFPGYYDRKTAHYVQVIVGKENRTFSQERMEHSVRMLAWSFFRN